MFFFEKKNQKTFIRLVRRYPGVCAFQLRVNPILALIGFIGLCLLAFAIILPLLGLIVLTVQAFAGQHRLAAALLVPYGVWTCYATYLNAGFLWLNPA